MNNQRLEVAVPQMLSFRPSSPEAGAGMEAEILAQFGRELMSSGAIDYVQLWDQLYYLWPPTLWTPENSPLAAMVPSVDSNPDPVVYGSMLSAAAPDLGIATTTDSIRRSPAELMQTMLTLASVTRGRAVWMIGAGENKQCKPFGHRRAQGIKRMEDLLRVINLFWECDGPVDFEGHYWKFEKAWLGSARPYKPQCWVLGGGPRLIELGARYADGIIGVPKQMFRDAEAYSEFVKSVRSKVEQHGRDPEQFRFGLMVGSLISDDEALIEQAVNSRIVRWLAAMVGRLNQADWRRDGFEPPFPDDWHYAKNFIPTEVSREQAYDVTDNRMSADMARAALYTGSPADIAAEIKPWIEAGASYITTWDMLPLIQPALDLPTAMAPLIDFARCLKA